MKTSRLILISLILFSILIRPEGQPKNGWGHETVDHSIYGELLKAHVGKGVVDYRGLKNHESKLNQYLNLLENTDPSGLSRDEQFAFYINVYNAWTLKLILRGYPGVTSIRDLGNLFKGPWKKKICRIDGDILTLDEIEHQILRPRFKDARVHFAINCAAKSCPPLMAEPYTGVTLNKQLDESAVGFINDSAFNRLEGATLYVSKIFQWFEGDFKGGIVEFFLKHARGNLKQTLETQKDRIKIRYLDYDWRLNGQ